MSEPRRSAGRPPAASRDTVEQIALALMMREGYENVNVDTVAAAAGIGRTTFFRYFGSKAGVIWYAFDATIAWLEEALSDAEQPTTDVVREAILSSTRNAITSSDVWLERFQLLDSHDELRSEAYVHWERWKAPIARFIASRIGGSEHDVVPMALAGACQGVYVAELRSWLNTDENRTGFLTRVEAGLRSVLGALGELLPDPTTAPPR